MKGGSFMRAMRMPFTQPQTRPTGKAAAELRSAPARRSGQPNCPITTEERIMIAADGQVDAGGQDDQRLRHAPTSPTIVTCCRTRVSEKADKNLLPHSHSRKHNSDSTRTISGTAAGFLMQEMLHLRDRGSCARIETRHGRVAARENLLELLRPPSACRVRLLILGSPPARSLPRLCGGRPKPPSDFMTIVRLSRLGKSTPAELQSLPWYRSIQRRHRLVGDQGRAGVEEGLAFGRSPAFCRCRRTS